MRKRLRAFALIVVVVVAVVTLGSCRMVLGVLFPNQLEFQGAEIELDKMYVIQWGSNGQGGNQVSIYLMSPGMTMDSNGNFAGSGSYVYAELSIVTNSLQTGDYDWNSSLDFVNGTLYWGGVNPSWSASDFGTTYNINGGSVSVEQSLVGNLWIIDMEMSTTNGTVYAHYRGEETLTYSLSVLSTRSVTDGVGRKIQQ